jgi:hypothetical protein
MPSFVPKNSDGGILLKLNIFQPELIRSGLIGSVRVSLAKLWLLLIENRKTLRNTIRMNKFIFFKHGPK